ncbi:MAG: hypothetical protein JNK87_40360 [Bryobacterales bacterium]|nr:hypothetical protein [Bryobacterales bacterium]
MPFDPKTDAKKVQGDLITLGYLPKGADDGKWGDGSKRAVKRFKRRAATSVYRINDAGAPADCGQADLFTGAVDDTVTDPTLAEMQKWITRKWKAPLGRFKLKTQGGATLREDVSDAWQSLATKIKGLGATIDGPYGDSKRRLAKVTKVGASSFSFHIVGRAVDLNQGLGGPPDHRYYVAKDFIATGNFWRIWCKAEKQDGTQGKEFKKGELEYWSFWGKTSQKAPAGWYIDLTTKITEDGKFERIKAHTGWEDNTNKSEWWHFQWVADKQATFEDECELIGITSKELKDAGYSETDRDRAPG